MASQLASTSAEVVILGGGVLVGRALELLLRSADCRVRFLDEASLGRLGPGESGPGDGVRLLILAPGASARCRDAVLAHTGSSAAGSRIKILELVTTHREAQVGARRCLPWPCRTKHLKRQVMAMLLEGPEESQEDRGFLQTPQKHGQMVEAESLD